MADNIDVTPGSGKTISTDERSIGGNTVHVQRINDIGGAAIVTGRATATTSSGSIIAARETRKRVIIRSLPTNSDSVDIGPSGATSGSDFPLYPGDSVTLETTAAIHADAASGSQVLAYIEEYDS